MVYNYEELDNHSDDPDYNVADTIEEPERQDIDICKFEKRKDKMGAGSLLEILSAHATHAAGHSARAARHASRSSGLGGNDIIDPQDHDRGFSC